MGLIEKNVDKYLTISNGKVVLPVHEGTEGAVPRTNKKGNTVWEKFYNSIEGVILSVDLRRNQDWEDDLIIKITDNGEIFQVQMPIDSRYAQSFMLCAKNIDTASPIRITPWSKTIDGKTKSRLYLQQHGMDIEYYHTKDDPKGMPQATKVMFKGKEQWDFIAQIEFLLKETLEHFSETTFIAQRPIQPESGYQAPGDKIDNDMDTDLPF